MKNHPLVTRISSLFTLLLALAFLPTACLGPRPSPSPHLHTLAPATIWDTFASRDLPADAPRIDIAPVTLPRHLDRPQIVILSDATPDAELIPLDQHRWATPLNASIRELLAARLLENLPTATIDLYPATTPSTPPAATVTLRILRMEAPLGSTLDLVASWQLSPTDAPRIAHYRALSADSSIPSYIRALREAVTLLADDISAHLSPLLPSESSLAPSESGNGPHRRAASPSKTTRKQKD